MEIHKFSTGLSVELTPEQSASVTQGVLRVIENVPSAPAQTTPSVSPVAEFHVQLPDGEHAMQLLEGSKLQDKTTNRSWDFGDLCDLGDLVGNGLEILFEIIGHID